MIFRALVRELREASLDLDFGWRSDVPPRRDGWVSWAGVPVTERRALQQLTVLSCVGLISDTIATMPIGAFQDVDEARIPVRPSPPFLDRPYSRLKRPDWIGGQVVSLTLRGNGYGRILGLDRVGNPTEIMPLHPSECSPYIDGNGRLLYRVAGERDPVPPEQIFHVRGLMVPGRYQVTGLDPIAYVRQTIGTALGAEEYGARWFGESAVPSVALESDQKIDMETAARYQTEWEMRHGGRSRRPAVLGGGLKVHVISLTPEESQFLATIEAKRAEIAGFFRVPPHMVGMVEKSTSWGTGIEEQMLGFVTFTLAPWVIRLEAALSDLLPEGQYVKFNIAGLLRGRLTERYRAYLMGRQGGWLSIDDVRRLEELPPLADGMGEDYLQPLNYAPIPPDGGGTQPAPEPSAVTESAP